MASFKEQRISNKVDKRSWRRESHKNNKKTNTKEYEIKRIYWIAKRRISKTIIKRAGGSNANSITPAPQTKYLYTLIFTIKSSFIVFALLIY